MSLNIFCKPRLLINDIEVAFCHSASFSKSMNSLEQFSATINEPEFENYNLFNQKIEFYLNYGSEDAVPLFRGYIKSFKANKDNISITAVDGRTFISGKDSLPVVIDKKNNYDGKTVVQFLIDIITNQLNLNKKVLTTDYINEMDKPVYMNNVRSEQAPYDIISNMVGAKRDDDNILNIFEYFFDIIHGEEYSGLVVKKTKELSSSSDFNFTYNDGIIDLNYTERAPPSFALAKSKDGTTVRGEYGNAPKGQVGITISGTYDSRAEAKEAAIAEILLKSLDDKEITLQVSKGHYMDLGHIIRIDVPDSNVNGQYRISSKRISYSENNVSCTLNLNKKPIKIRDYLPF
jgi:hypothetical protein